MNEALDSQLLREIYASTVSPERFEELLSTWERHLVQGADASQSLMETPEVRDHLVIAAEIFDQVWTDNDDPNDAAEIGSVGVLYPWLECDVQGTVLDLNTPAQERYGISEQSNVDTLPFTANSLQRLRTAIKTTTQAQSPVSLVMNRDDARSKSVSVMSVQHVSSARVRITTNDIAWTDKLKELLKSSFGLSTAEYEVLQLLAEGANAAHIASVRKSAVTTVRVQIRSIYDKTGVRNQPELLRLTLGVATLIQEADPPAVRPAQSAAIAPESNQIHDLPLSDGRNLQYADFASPSGDAVLFLHDEYFGFQWPRSMADYARERSLRIVAPARGGYGATDRYPTDSDCTQQFCHDVIELLRHLNIDRFAILARRTGFRYGLYLAHMLPDKVRAFVVQSPALPADTVQRYRKMTRFARFISITAHQHPALLEFMVRAGIRYYESKGAKQFARMLNKGSPADLQVLEHPMHWQVIQTGLRMSSTNGYYGYLHDVRHDRQDAWAKVVATPVPIHCLIGDLDPNDRHDRAQEIIDAGANITIETVQDAGQLFFYTHPDTVIDAVLSRLH